MIFQEPQKFGGSTPSNGTFYAGSFNESAGTAHGLIVYAGTQGKAVHGRAVDKGTASIGVSGENSTGIGVSGAASSGVGVRCSASTGTALQVLGDMTISTNALVSNLNADMVDSKHATSFCQVVPTNSGTAVVAASSLSIQTAGTLASSVRTRGFGNFIAIENISDKRLKQDIEDEQYGLDFINSLRPRSFRMKANPKLKAHGLIYQEVRELVDNDDSLACLNSDGETGAVDYNGIISPLIKAIQELSKQVEELKNGQSTSNSD